MKQCLLFTIFVAAIWLILVASYAIFECSLEAKGMKPISTFPFRTELLNALNVPLPVAVACLMFLLKANKTNPVGPEVLRLCLITGVLAVFLGFKAKNLAYPDPADPAIAEAIWWLPDQGPGP